MFAKSIQDMINHRVEIFNELNFTNTSKYEISWTLMQDGEAIDTGIISPDVAPGERKTVTIPFVMPETLAKDGEYYLNFSVKTKEAEDFLPAGYEIAHEQVRVPAEVSHIAPVDSSQTGNVSYTTDGDAVTVSGDRFSFAFDKKTGAISSYQYDGNTILTKGPVPNYWRAGNDNDVDSNGNPRSNSIDTKWKNANKGMTVTSAVNEKDNTVVITATMILPNANNSKQVMEYTVYGTGEIKVKADLEPAAGLNGMLKYGAQLTMPKGYEKITWYGRGAAETYQDRKLGAPVGIYETTVSDSYFSFIRPQDTGNRTDVRYIALEDAQNPIGLMVVSEDVMEASALHFTVDELSGKRHTYQLPQTDHTILNIDHQSRGTGGASCGPETRPEYQMPGNQNYSYTYTLIPYETDKTTTSDMTAVSKVWRDAESIRTEDINKREAAATDRLIDEIGILLSYSQKKDIEAARKAYDKLSSAQQELVTSLETLVKAEAEIESFKGAKAYVKDQSGNFSDAEITETAKIFNDPTSPTGYAMKGYVEVPDVNLVNANLSGRDKSFTVEVWVNPSELTDGNTFIAKGDHQLSLKTNKGGIEFFIYDNGWRVVNPTNIAGWSANQWHHIVGTYDGSSLSLYVNGVLAGRETYNNININGTSIPLGIGAAVDNSQYRMRGRMGAANIFKKALTADEIAARFTAYNDQTPLSIGADHADTLLWYAFSDAYAVKAPAAELSSIEVIPPAKTEYQIGEAFDATGMTVTAKYSDGTEALLGADAYTLTGFDASSAGEKVITVSYQEGAVTKTATFNITVIGENPSGTLESDVYDIDVQNGLVRDVSISTTLEAFVQNFKNPERSITVLNRDGNEVQTGQLIGTGYIVQLTGKDGEILQQILVVIMGDSNGDGNMNIYDLLTTKMQILGQIDFDIAQQTAADMNHDGRINIFDLLYAKLEILNQGV